MERAMERERGRTREIERAPEDHCHLRSINLLSLIHISEPTRPY